MRVASFALVLAVASACGEGSPISPLPQPTKDDVGPNAGTTGGGTVAPPPRKREVLARNPFGGPPANLFVDGDFELSTLPEGQQAQTGWRAFSGNGMQGVSIPTETGGVCRTGLRCAVMRQNMILFARGAAAPHGAGHIASVWTRPPPAVPCADVGTFVLVVCDKPTVALGTLKAATEEPEASGWCEHRSTLGSQGSAVCLYLESLLSDDQIALVDSATLLADDGSASIPSEAWTPPPEMTDRMNAVRDLIRKSHRFGRPLGWDDDGFPLRAGASFPSRAD